MITFTELDLYGLLFFVGVVSFMLGAFAVFSIGLSLFSFMQSRGGRSTVRR